jgi:enterobacteria phage integrase
MPRKLPPHVERNHVKGKTYLSFRIGQGPRIRLPDDPTSAEFHDAYRDALLGQTPARRRQPIVPGTIAALIVSYMKSRSYTGLRATTKKGYATRIEILRIAHGHRAVEGLTRERIETGILAPYHDRPGAALSLLKMCRMVCGKLWVAVWLMTVPQHMRSWPCSATQHWLKPSVTRRRRIAAAAVAQRSQS